MADELTPSHLTVRLLRLPTHRTLAAAHDPGPAANRLLTVVAGLLDGDRSLVAGWGECSALSRAGYTAESAEGAFELLGSGGPIDAGSSPMAASAIETMLLDIELRAGGRSLADHLGTVGGSAPAGAVVGLSGEREMLDEVEALAAAGYRRVKLKVVPDRVVEPAKSVRERFPDLELQIDGNGSLGSGDVDDLIAVSDLGVRVIEQPFAVGDSAAAARLVDATDLVVLADEAVIGPASVAELAELRAASGVVVKPPKLGGVAGALDTLARVADHSLEASLGGMLESGLGRHLLAAMAPLPGFTVTGDLSPASLWLASDPFPDIEVVDGRVVAPSCVGIAPDPDADLLDRHTVASATVAMPRVAAR